MTAKEKAFIKDLKANPHYYQTRDGKLIGSQGYAEDANGNHTPAPPVTFREGHDL